MIRRGRPLAALAAITLGGVGGGCTGADDGGSSTDGPRTSALLVDMTAWGAGDAAVEADPLPDHRPVEGDCPEGSSLMEGGSFEVRTGTCTYGWFQQPSLADLRVGDVVELVYWHSTLVSDPPAEGHFALYVGDDPLFDATIPIPHDPAAYTEQVTVAAAAPVGAIVTLHVHNHGANDWNFLRVERQGVDAR